MVRHGDTALNDENLVHGWVDTPLNDKGIEQAHKAAESLKDKDITHIVSSDLPRAKQTANILSKATGAPVITTPSLRTWDSGNFDYTDKHEELEKYTQPSTKDLVNQNQQRQDRYDALMRIKKNLIDNDVHPYPTEQQQIESNSKYPFNEHGVRSLTPDEKSSILKEIESYGKDPYIVPGEYDTQTNEGVATVVKNDTTPPPGSSESFSQFKDRALSSIKTIAATNQGNTVILTHSKAIRAWNAWEKAGYPEDNSIHQATYQEVGQKPGGHEEVKVPDHVVQTWRHSPYSFDQRFSGEPTSLPLMAPGEKFGIVKGQYITEHATHDTLKDSVVRPRWPTDTELMSPVYYPEVDPTKLENMMEDPDSKLRSMLGVRPGMEAGGGSKSERSIKDMLDSGMTSTQVSKELGVSLSTARRRMREQGLEAPGNKDLWSQDKTDLLKKRLLEGKHMNEIAKELGITPNAVIGKVNRLRGYSSYRTERGESQLPIKGEPWRPSVTKEESEVFKPDKEYTKSLEEYIKSLK